MTALYLCVDTGGSQTKIIYQVSGSHQPSYLLMPPEVEPITATKLKQYQERKGWIGSPSPMQQAWLEVNNEVWVVGAFASQFDPEDRLFELKYENALYKVLVAIGVIASQHQLVKSGKKKQLKVALAILLPWNEYSDRKRFGRRLEKLLADYKFRGERLSVKLSSFVCRPEGGGLVATRLMVQGLDWLRKRRLAVLMFGHRNTTSLYFEYGELKSGSSPLLGFAQMLDAVVEMTSGLDRERLASAMCSSLHRLRTSPTKSYWSGEDWQLYKTGERFGREYGYTVHPEWEKLPEIHSLATAKDETLRSLEGADIAAALSAATADYWDRIKKWLSKTLPERLDEVIISGGAAPFLEPELEAYFNCVHCLKKLDGEGSLKKVRSGEYQALDSQLHFTPIVWGAGITSMVSKLFKLTDQPSQEAALAERLVDAYSLFDYLLKQLQEASSESKSRSAKRQSEPGPSKEA